MAKSNAARDDRAPRRPAAPADTVAPAPVPPPAAPRGRRAAGTASAAAAPDLDQVIHERMRLGIVSALAVHESLTFVELKALLGASDGNLSVHARRLEDAGYVACRKSFEGRVPKTEYRLSAEGRRALERYLDHMEALIRATRER